MYDPNSCNALEKPFYTPVEAALRWCGLIKHEVEILSFMEVFAEPIPSAGDFPQWPCLRANAEKIADALDNKEMPCGRDGKTVGPDDHVAPYRRTVRHTDLKEWMAKYYPDQKPSFLFGEIERTTHSSITVDAWQTLQADRDSLRARVEKAEEWYRTEGAHLKRDNEKLRQELEQYKLQEAEPGAKSRNAYLRTIAAMGSALAGKPTGKHHTDAEAILSVLASKGIDEPVGKAALSDYLKEAYKIKY